MPDRRKLSKAERRIIYDKLGGRCAYCGCDLAYEDMQVDHFLPIRGGEERDKLDNMLPACRTCPQADKPAQYRMERGGGYGGLLPLPDQKYNVIYADPPWAYRQCGATAKSRGNAIKHYPTMTTADISTRRGWFSLFSMGNFPKHCRGHQGHGGVGVRVQNSRFRMGQKVR